MRKFILDADKRQLTNTSTNGDLSFEFLDKSEHDYYMIRQRKGKNIEDTFDFNEDQLRCFFNAITVESDEE